MLNIEKCCLAVVDVQGKLAQLMHEKENLFKNIEILITAAEILKIPIIWCEQVPKALGPTIPQIAELMASIEPVTKSSFSCCRDDQFKSKLESLKKEHVILCGIETHICIYQTAVDLLDEGKNVNVRADAVSSRTCENKLIALSAMAAKGAQISTVEMLLFELLKTANHPKFKAIARLIK